MVLATILLLIAVMLASVDGADEATLWTTHGMSSEPLTRFMLVVTQLGSTAVVAALAVGWMLAWRRRDWRAALMPSLAGIGAGVTSLLIKALVHRPRPEVVQALVHVDSFSFPSGHALLSMAFYGTVALELTADDLRRGTRIAIWLMAGVLVLLIGASRVYLGVHYPSDVLGGYALGAGWLAVMSLIPKATGAGPTNDIQGQDRPSPG